MNGERSRRICRRAGALLAGVLLALPLLGGCRAGAGGSSAGGDGYRSITAAEAKAMLDQGGVTLVDVRTQEEYAAGHIEGARLIPDTEIAKRAAAELPDRDAVLLVYCRTGRRSLAASKELVSMGYTRVYDLGGIVDWPYGTVQ